MNLNCHPVKVIWIKTGLMSSINTLYIPPGEYLGSCIEAGYNSSDMCCVSGFCAGLPAVCMCDLECYERGDCCSDIHDSCTEG